MRANHQAQRRASELAERKAVRRTGPHLRRGDEQAGVAAGLQEELQPPARAVTGVVLFLGQGPDLGEPETRAGGAGRLGADGVPRRHGLGQRAERRAGGQPVVGGGERGQPGVDGALPTAVRDTGAGEPIADGPVDQDVQRVRDERGRVGGEVRGAGGLGPGDRRHRGDERLDRGLVDALHDGPPAGARPGGGPLQGRQHVAAAGEVVRERDDGPHVRDGRAVAQLLRRVVELRRVHGDGGHGPRPQLGCPAGRGTGCGADEPGGRQRAAGVGREQERDLGGCAGVQGRQRGGGHGERVRAGGAQGPAAPGGGPLPVFGPQQHAPPRRPQGVHHEHPATLRPPPDTPAHTA